MIMDSESRGRTDTVVYSSTDYAINFFGDPLTEMCMLNTKPVKR